MTDDNGTPVTERKCTRRHARIWTICTGIVGVFGVFLTVDLVQGVSAKRQAERVDTKLQVHEASQSEHEKHLKETLARIEKSLAEVLRITKNGK